MEGSHSLTGKSPIVLNKRPNTARSHTYISQPNSVRSSLSRVHSAGPRRKSDTSVLQSNRSTNTHQIKQVKSEISTRPQSSRPSRNISKTPSVKSSRPQSAISRKSQNDRIWSTNEIKPQNSLSVQGSQSVLNTQKEPNSQSFNVNSNKQLSVHDSASEEDETVAFKRKWFGHRANFVGSPEKIKTTYDDEYFKTAVEPRLQDRSYRFFVNRQKGSPNTSIFKNDLLPMVRNFLLEDCDANERQQMEAFIKHLTQDLEKYKLASPFVVATVTSDQTFFQVQQYACTFLQPYYVAPLREWLKDEVNKKDIPLFKTFFSRFNNYHLYARGTTSYETDHRVILACPRDRDLAKSLEGAVQDKLVRRAKLEREKTQVTKPKVLGKLGTFKTVYSQHFPAKTSDSYRKFIENKQKRIEDQKLKKPYGTLNVHPTQTTNQHDFPEKRVIHPLLKTVRMSHSQEVTASIAHRSQPHLIDITSENNVNKEVTASMEGVTSRKPLLKHEAIPYPKAKTTNEAHFIDTTGMLKARMKESGDKLLFDMMKRSKPKPFDVSFSGKIPNFMWNTEYKNAFHSS